MTGGELNELVNNSITSKERTDRKLKYARIHLDELINVEQLIMHCRRIDPKL